MLEQIIGVPATTVARDIPTEVPLSRGDGMPRACVLSLDNITVIRRSLCVRRITTLSPEKMSEAFEALKAATAC